MEVVGLADGTVVIITGMEAPPTPGEYPVPGTLSLPIEVGTWIGEAVAAGVTFDILKEIALALARKGWSSQGNHATAESVTQTVVSYLRSVGYVDVAVTKVRRIADEGWTLAGTADGSRFSAMASDSGSLIHVHVR